VVNSTGQGILVEDNTDTTILFAGQTTINTTSNVDPATNTGVLLDDNATGSIRFNNLDITTATGIGFSADDTDSVTVAGTGNTITTSTGIGLSLTDVVVGTTGVTFESVDVSNGGTNGIVLNNVTGGLVDITGTGSTDDSGGTILTEGDSILITNAARVSINNMNLRTTGVDASSQAVDYNVTNTNQSRFELNNNNITVSDAAAEEAVLLNIGGAANRADIRLTFNEINATGSGAEALRLQTANTPALKTINLLAQNNIVTANTATPGTNIEITGGAVLNGTITNNAFANNGAGQAMEIETNGGTVHLSFNANDATSAGDMMLLTNTAGTFEVVDQATVGPRNNNEVTPTGVIANETDAVPTPQAP
jgi:hypothetical protein